MAVSDRLQKFCETHRITQKSLQEKGFGSIQTVNNYVNGKTAGLLFKTISEQRMNVKLKDIVAGAGIPKKITNHSGRHTFATIYLSKTKDLAGLQKLLGHSSIAQTMIYAHINDEMLVKNMEAFEKELVLHTTKKPRLL